MSDTITYQYKAASGLNKSQKADELIVHIHSVGGEVYEGWGIYDALINSGKKLKTTSSPKFTEILQNNRV